VLNPVKLWVATPTKMNEDEPINEGYSAHFSSLGPN
jgi:aconitase B